MATPCASALAARPLSEATLLAYPPRFSCSLVLPVDSRDYRAACEILDDLGVNSVRLMTKNPDKARALVAHGVTVVEQRPHESFPTPYGRSYLKAKRDHMGHTLQLLD
jgi:3,4-dihydroxy 2-butanone 4-phosphate synthase/GTP cyclohydrolase II